MTLIELLIVVAVVAILGAVAYPTYTAHVQRSNRAAAKVVLEQAAQYMERQFTIKSSYPTDTELAAAGFTYVPLGSNSSTARYKVELATTTATTFTLKATPQSGSIDPDCGYLTLDHIGKRGSEGADAGKCWAR